MTNQNLRPQILRRQCCLQNLAFSQCVLYNVLKGLKRRLNANIVNYGFVSLAWDCISNCICSCPTVFLLKYFFSSCRAYDFLGHSAQIFSFILRSCHNVLRSEKEIECKMVNFSGQIKFCQKYCVWMQASDCFTNLHVLPIPMLGAYCLLWLLAWDCISNCKCSCPTVFLLKCI